MSHNPRMVRPYERHQVPTITPSEDWAVTRNRNLFPDELAPAIGDSWWTGYASPSQPRTEDFYAEVARRAAVRANKAEKAPRGQTAAAWQQTPKEPITRACDVCGDLFTVKPKGPHARRCSPKCNQRAWKLKQKAS